MGLFGMSREMKELKRKADAGDAEAQYRLAAEYQGGKGSQLKKDLKQVVYYSEKAAEQGHLKAQDLLAFCYYYGKGVEKDLEKAKYWKRKGAELGDVRAQCGLAFYYEQNATGVADLKEAFRWYLKAAEQDAPQAQYEVAKYYYDGYCVSRDVELALYWAEKAAPGLEREAEEVKEDAFSFQYHTEQVQKNKELLVHCKEERFLLQDPVYQNLLLAILRAEALCPCSFFTSLSKNEIAPSLNLNDGFVLRDNDPLQQLSAQIQELLGVTISKEELEGLETVECIYNEICFQNAFLKSDP